MLDLLRKGSKNQLGLTRKTWSLDFFWSPTGLLAPSTPSDKALLSLALTQLNPALRAVPTGETSTDLVVIALGHCAEPSAPWYDPALGYIRTLGARIVDATAGRIVRTRTRAAGR